MKNRVIQETNQRIDEILKKANQQREDLQNKLEEAQAAVLDAHRRMEEAQAVSNVAAYHAAKLDAETAATSVDMYAQRLSQICGNYLVPADENTAMVVAIRAEQKELEEKTVKYIIDRLRDIEKIGKNYFESQDALNKLLKRWHKDIYKQPHPRAPKRPADTWDLDYDDGELRSCITSLVTLYFYRKQIGRTQYRGVGSIWE